MKVTIIGGGMGGCGTALEFAEAGFEVDILESRSTLLSGSSDDTPCRLGLGFHYIDIDTAKKYLHATIQVVKKYSKFILANEKSQEHPYRRGRYFITKNSLFPLRQIEQVYEELKQEYTKLIEEDEKNAVFGFPDQFYRYLTVSEYQEDVNTDMVVAGIETAEQILNWPELKKYLIEKIEQHPNIRVHKNIEVTKVEHSANDSGFIIKAIKNKITRETIGADFIINAAWENIEAINHTAGFFATPNARTNRLKVIVEIKLPEKFEEKKCMNSMFFCFGPHCAFTNMGDGTGFISYEPVTNIEVSTSLHLPPLSKKLFYNATDEEKTSYGKKILEGVVQYIPKLEGAEFLSTKFGIVKTKGAVDIYSKDSQFHKRDYSGVESQQIRWIDNACMKLLYFLENAKLTKALFDQHLVIDKAIEEIASCAISSKNININPAVMKHMITKNLQRYLALEGVDDNKIKKIIVSIDEVISNKSELMKGILRN